MQIKKKRTFISIILFSLISISLLFSCYINHDGEKDENQNDVNLDDGNTNNGDEDINENQVAITDIDVLLDEIWSGLEGYYYIRQGAFGNESGSDWFNAFTEIPSELQRNCGYYIADGEYGLYTFDDIENGEKFIYIKKATDTEHGTDDGWQNSFGDEQAKFSWIGSLEAGNVISFKTSYWIFDGATGGGPNNWTNRHGFKITTDNPKATLVNITHNGNGTAVAGHIKIYHTELAHAGRERNPDALGTYGPLAIRQKSTNGTASSGGHHFAFNYVHDSPAMLFWGYETGSFILEYNYFDTSAAYEPGSNNQGSGLTTYSPHSQVYRFNIFKDMKGSCGICLYTWHGDLSIENVQIYGNIFYYSPAFKAEEVDSQKVNFVQNGWITSDGGTDEASDIKIYNNSFINLNGRKMFWLGYPEAPDNEIINNIIYNCQGVRIDEEEFQGFSHSHNLFYNNTDYRNGDIILDNNWADQDNNSQIGTDCPCNDWENEDFGLKESADPGYILEEPYNIDMNKKTRGADGTWDMGAYEYVE